MDGEELRLMELERLVSKNSPQLVQARARNLLLAMIGSARGWAILFIILFLVAESLFTSSVYEIIVERGAQESWIAWISSVLLLLLVVGAWLLARKAGQEIVIEVSQAQAAPCRALILFLSKLQPGGLASVKTFIDSVTSAEFSDKTYRKEHLTNSWLMPIEAIAHHRSALQFVLVVTSPESVGQFDEFVRLVNLQAGAEPQPLEILGPKDVSGPKLAPVHFENVDGLVKVIEGCFTWLCNEKGLKKRDIVIDVTGGQKPTTVAGAVVALADGRQFQYVSTEDQSVQTYDITYGTGE